jgi:hypothetical protein
VVTGVGALVWGGGADWVFLQRMCPGSWQLAAVALQALVWPACRDEVGGFHGFMLWEGCVINRFVIEAVLVFQALLCCPGVIKVVVQSMPPSSIKPGTKFITKLLVDLCRRRPS